MSIFDQTKGQPEGDSDNQSDWLSKVVEAKGEKFKDPQVLAKSKLEADEHIKNLETQLAEIRDELKKQDFSAQLLDKLKNKDTPQQPAPSDTKPEVSEELLKTLVEKTLTDREKANTSAQNQRVVVETLAQKYGTEAKAHVATKARELGMTVERLEELAAESPNAFFALIGEPRKEFTPVIKGSVNTQSVTMQAPVERDWSYYQKLRKENKHLYYNPSTQQQMFKDKARLGERFGNT